MPWSYPDNVPSVAKNWTEAEQKACIAAGNAVLERGGTDKEAIFACIHAAGKSKKDATEVDLMSGRFTILAAAKAARKGRKMPRPPQPPSIKILQLAYFRELRGIVDALKRLTKEILIPQVPAIFERARSLRPSADSERSDSSYTDYIEELMDLLRREFGRIYTEEELKRMAERMAEQINGVNGRYYDRLFNRILFGVGGIRYEPWLQQEIAAFTKMNVSLIKSIPEKYFEQVEQIVSRGAQAGTLGKDIAAQIKGRFEVTENRALLIARDQVSKFNGTLNNLRQTEAGISKYEWQTAGDERVRGSHAAHDGKIFSWSDPPSTGHPGDDINCRCVALPIIV